MTTGQPPSPPPPPARGTRAPYSKPRLNRYGSVGVATAGFGGGGEDFASELLS